MSVRLRAHILLLAVVFVWGATFALNKYALQDISPLLFNLIRMALAFTCLAVVYHRQLRTVTRQAIVSGAFVGFFLALGYQFQTAGLALTTPSKSAFVTGMSVVLVSLLSVFPPLRAPAARAPRWNAFLGAGLAFAGIVLLTAPAVLTSGWTAINAGDLLTFGCALSYAFHLLAVARVVRRVRYEQLAVLQIGFCALFTAVSTPLLERPHLVLSPKVAVAILVAAFLATAAAFTIQSWAQQYLPATHAAAIFALEPVFAWLTSFLFLHERLGLTGTVGALLILLGIAFTELLFGDAAPIFGV